MKPDKELSQWCSALCSRYPAETVPDGWLTAVQLAEKIGKSRHTVSRNVAAAIRAGKIEMKKFRVVNGQRGLYPTPHYRLLK